MASVDELIAALNASKQAAEELRAQIEADTQMAEELSARLEEIGVTAAVAALQSCKSQTEQAGAQAIAAATSLEEAAQAAEASKQA